jgi:hypothetical protein
MTTYKFKLFIFLSAFILVSCGRTTKKEAESKEENLPENIVEMR